MRRTIQLVNDGTRVLVNEDSERVSLALSSLPVFASVTLTTAEAERVAAALMEVSASVKG